MELLQEGQKKNTEQSRGMHRHPPIYTYAMYKLTALTLRDGALTLRLMTMIMVVVVV
jgi:hypothetical protein